METCQGNKVRESSYVLVLPNNYMPTLAMPKLSVADWKTRIRFAEQVGELRSDLVDKICNSLDRMPVLLPDQKVSVSYSGGKDSEVIFILAIMQYPRDRIFSLFADTEDEWPDTYTHIDQFEAWAGSKIHRLQTMGIHALLRGETGLVACWPRPGRRHCTKNLKMLPQRDWLDRMGYGQVRVRGVDAYRNGQPLKLRHPAPWTFAGERWAESANRALLPIESRDDVIMRMTHRPVIDWTIEDVWDFIFWMQAPVNPVYLKGIKRVACAGCIFANQKEIELLGEHHPEILEKWVETEAKIGYPWKGKTASMQGIYDKLATEGRLGTK